MKTRENNGKRLKTREIYKRLCSSPSLFQFSHSLIGTPIETIQIEEFSKSISTSLSDVNQFNKKVKVFRSDNGT